MTPDILTETLEETDGGAADSTVVTATPPANETESVVAVVPGDIEADLAKDTLFELLKNQRRRDALDFLRENDGWTTLSDMAEHIAAKENDLPIEGINSKQRKRVYIGLYQCHLPKLAKAGVVNFDKNRGTIEVKDLAAQLYPYLGEDTKATEETTEADADETESTAAGSSLTALSRKSSLTAGVGIAALAGVAGVPGLELLGATGWVVVTALTLLGSAALPFVRD